MASISQKVPIPLPTAGVLKDQNPRKIGSGGMSGAMNWVYRDGRFRVRPGLNHIGDPGINLIPWVDDAVYEDGESLAWINDEDLFPTDSFTADLTANTDPNDMRRWGGYSATDETRLNSALSFEVWDGGVPDPAFLNHGGDGYPYLAFNAGDDISVCGPMVPISQGPIQAQIKTAQGGTIPLDPSMNITLTLQFVYWNGTSYTMMADPPSTTDPELQSGVMIGLENGVYREFNVQYDNDGTWTHAFIKVDFPSETRWAAFSEAMIYYGEDYYAYDDPTESGSGWYVGERPMGMGRFEVSTGTTLTVMGTDVRWHEMESDLSWTPITGGDWSTTQQRRNLPVFRVFDATYGVASGEGTAKRWLIGVNGSSNAKAWDGSASAFDIEMYEDPPPAPGSETYLKPRCLAISGNRVLYANTAEVPDGVYHTEDLTIDGWENNLARLADTPGEIVAMLEMGSLQTAVYKTDAIYMAISQGGALPFRFDMRTANIDGPASALSVVAVSDGMHVYLSHTGDVVMFDGVRPRSMGSHLQSYIQSNMNINAMDQSFAFYDNENKDIYFFYPPYNSEEAHNCVIINVAEQFPTLWPLRFPEILTAGGRTMLNTSKSIDELEGTIDELEGTIDDYAQERAALLILSGSGSSRTFDGVDDSGIPIPYRLRTGLFDMGSITTWKTVKEIDHLFRCDPGQELTVKLIRSDFGYEEETDGEQDIALTEGSRKLSRHRSTGRLFALDFTGEADGKIEWFGSEASVAERGLR